MGMIMLYCNLYATVKCNQQQNGNNKKNNCTMHIARPWKLETSWMYHVFCVTTHTHRALGVQYNVKISTG